MPSHPLIALSLTALVALAVAGCATHPDKIAAASASPLAYQSYDCMQIATEERRINGRASELYGQLKDEANADTAQMTLGLVLVWPALFFLEGGDGPQAQEYARLKGEHQALQQAAVEKKCSAAGPSVIPTSS